MSSPRTEVLLAQVRTCLKGELPPEELVAVIETVVSSMEEKLQNFLLDTDGDPEMPPEIRNDISQALRSYLECLAHMRDVTLSGDMTALAECGGEAQQKVECIRNAQSAHREALSAGPTHFPYLNRLIIQYEAVRKGGDDQKLDALLDDAPNFSRWLRTELAVRTATPEEVQMVFHLEQFITALQNSLRAQDENLPDIQEDLTALSSHLASLLAEAPDRETTEGPTQIIAVNQVFGALSSCTGAKPEVDFLVSVITQCRFFLQTILPINSSGQLVAKLSAVLESLDEIETCMKEQTGYEELVEAAGALESSANILAEAVAKQQSASTAESAEFSKKTQGLPVIFKSVLAPAFGFLEGGGDAEDVFAASDHLEMSVTEMQQEIARIPPDDPRLAHVSEGLELMREAANLLRDLATTGNERLLEYATDLSFQAAGKLAEAGVNSR